MAGTPGSWEHPRGHDHDLNPGGAVTVSGDLYKDTIVRVHNQYCSFGLDKPYWAPPYDVSTEAVFDYGSTVKRIELYEDSTADLDGVVVHETVIQNDNSDLRLQGGSQYWVDGVNYSIPISPVNLGLIKLNKWFECIILHLMDGELYTYQVKQTHTFSELWLLDY